MTAPRHHARESSNLLEQELRYLARGLPIFPVCDTTPHTHPDAYGKPLACVNRGKVPLVRWKVYQDRLPTEVEVFNWHRRWPVHNVGMATGHLSGIVVVDLDGELAIRTAQGRGYANGPHVFTGRVGGQHRYFAWQTDAPRNFVKRDGIDFRGEGGYVILPPSRHELGRNYVWGEEIGDLDDLPVLPDWLSAPVLRTRTPEDASEIISEGARNQRLTSIAGSLRHHGADEEAILGALLGINARQCQPPLSVGEVQTIAASVARYEPEPDDSPRIRLNGRASPGRTFVITNLATVQAEVVRWLWHYRIPLGKLTLLDGDPDLGKSLTTLDIAARLSTGHAMPDGTHAFDGTAGTVLLSAEDGVADTIRPRLDAAGGDPTRVVVLEGVIARTDSLPAMPSLEDLDAIEAAVRSVDAKLIVVDPIMAYLPSSVDSFKDQQVRRMLAPLVRLIERLDVALICIRHLTKDASKPALYRGGASIGFAGAARSVMLIAPDPSDQTQTKRILARIKGNLAPRVPSLIYEVVMSTGLLQPQIRWHKETSGLNADDLLRPRESETAEVQSQLADAEDFLRTVLADGPRPVQQVLAEAQEAMISKRTIERARTRLGIKAWHVGESKGKKQHWLWGLQD